MKRLFDSTLLIAHLRGDPAATGLLLDTPGAGRLTSVLSRIEIEGGMRSGERAAVGAMFGVLTLVPVSDAVARQAGVWLRAYRRSHRGIDLVDYVVAATARLYEAELLTLNVKHFPMFEDLAPAF